MKNRYIIRQLSDKEFIILKRFENITYSGMLWFKKRKVSYSLHRIDRLGRKLYMNYNKADLYIHSIGSRFDTNIDYCMFYETKKEAVKWIEDFESTYIIDQEYKEE